MRSTLTVGAIATLLALGVACAEGPAGEAEGTDATTETLLTAAGAVDAPTGSLPPGAPRALNPQPQTVDIAVMGIDRGDPEAPVRVVEFSDYGCGYCRQFHLETWPALMEDFIGVGKVEWKFLPYVSGMFDNSPAAALAAECVLEQGDDLFDDMNVRVWEAQREWKNAGDPAPILRNLATETGADMGTFDACLTEGRREWRVDASTQLARQLGVRATPTFFVVGYPPIQGALPADVFLEVLNTVYAEATRGGGDR